MKNRVVIITLFVISIVMLSACQALPDNVATPADTFENGYPIITPTSYTPGYPEPEIKIEQTAFEAFEVAKIEADKWNSEAVFYGIPATFMMELNLGYPGIGSGWFFMFKIPNQPLEYYVMVDNGEVKGMTEAQPVIVGKRTIDYLPLPTLDKLIDSDKILDIFNNNGGKEYLAENPDAILNPQLYFLNSNDFPVWSLYDVNKGASEPSLFNVNALTGEPVPLD